LDIIVAAGVCTYESAPFCFAYRGPALNEALGTEVPDPMAEMFVKDITDGVADTGVQAGMLKCAIDHQGSRSGTFCLTAARAARVCGGIPGRRGPGDTGLTAAPRGMPRTVP
jgi:phosphotriesterase-related protein